MRQTTVRDPRGNWWGWNPVRAWFRLACHPSLHLAGCGHTNGRWGPRQRHRGRLTWLVGQIHADVSLVADEDVVEHIAACALALQAAIEREGGRCAVMLTTSADDERGHPLVMLKTISGGKGT